MEWEDDIGAMSKCSLYNYNVNSASLNIITCKVKLSLHTVTINVFNAQYVLDNLKSNLESKDHFPI